MPLQAKLIFLSLVPLLLVTVITSWISIHQAKTLGAQEIQSFEQGLIRSKESALKDSVDLALDAIGHIYHDKSLPQDLAQQRVKHILNHLRYGKENDGYFFVYDINGINVVHPVQSELIGQDLLHIQDESGNYVIMRLLEQAQAGGGFHRYLWQKPSTGEEVPKLSYAAWLDEWQWMVGTGLYVEDITQEVAKLRSEVDKNIETTFFSVIVIMVITVAVIVVITLAVNLHEHRLADKSLKELAHKTVMFQEDEKKQLARELHDGINQLLVSSKCHLDLMQTERSETQRQQHLQQSQRALLTAINEVRHISHQLRPSALDDIGLNAALKTLLQDFQLHAQIGVETSLCHPATKLSSEVATTLYRIAQESLTNIEKHAHADLVTVILQQMGAMMQLIIRDNGRGFDVSSAMRKSGIGLRNMRERVEFIGGEIEIESEPGFGTEITVLLTLEGNHYG
ncbi:MULTISPECIES: cache domain-containing protein [unclassified Vibrio]|uniref:Cache domain-containing protein n=1 Tax=Vibrio sp. HB236076 TaxID=3232307 RepID=A0AB39HEK9_9VIBR|nr:cache domain-containing protein [Vibrio sp. HB161653]MDP5254116.1 cache domain-containing protein [Vibrio sp. HB161653]